MCDNKTYVICAIMDLSQHINRAALDLSDSNIHTSCLIRVCFVHTAVLTCISPDFVLIRAYIQPATSPAKPVVEAPAPKVAKKAAAPKKSIKKSAPKKKKTAAKKTAPKKK